MSGWVRRAFVVAGGLVAVTAAALATAAPAAAADRTPVAVVADVLDLATYRVLTTYRAPSGAEVVRTTSGVVGVPALVDVHGGLSLPDLAVTVLPTLTKVHLTVDRILPVLLPPAQLPVKVEVIFDLPGGLGGAFGYDQRNSTAPHGWRASLDFFVFDPPENEYNVIVVPRNAPASLTLTGELFTRGASGARVDPKRGSLTMSPVPASTDFGVKIATPAPAQRTITATVAPSTPTVADVTAADVTGVKTLTLGARIDKLPSATTVGYDEEKTADGTTHRKVTSQASAPIGRVDALVTQATGAITDRTIDAHVTGVPASFTADLSNRQVKDAAGNVVLDDTNVAWTAAQPVTSTDVTVDEPGRQVVAHAEGVPTGLTVHYLRTGLDDPATKRDERHYVVDAVAPDAAIGLLRAGLRTGGVVVFPDPATLFEPGELDAGEVPSYAVLDDDDATLQLSGLRSVAVDTAAADRPGTPLVVGVTAAPGPLAAKQLSYTGGKLTRELKARVLDRPATTTVVYTDQPGQPRHRSVGYTGSAPADAVKVVARDDVDTTQPTTVHADVTGVPASFDVGLDTGRTPENVDTIDATYAAPAGVGGLDLTADTFDTFGRPVHLEAHPRTLPASFTLRARLRPAPLPAGDDGTARIEFAAGLGQALGVLDALVLTGGGVTPPFDARSFFDPGELTPAEQPSYAFVHDHGAVVRLSSVREATVDTQNPLEVHLAADRQKLLVRQLDKTRTVQATVFDLPSRLDLTVDKRADDSFAASYDASQRIDRVEAFATDTVVPLVEGSEDREGLHSMDLLVDDVPTHLELASLDGGIAVTTKAAAAYDCEPPVPDVLCAGTHHPLDPSPGQSLGPAVGEAQALLTTAIRLKPVADDQLGKQVSFDFEPDPAQPGRLASTLATGEDGVLLNVTSGGFQSLYGRARDVARMQFASVSDDRNIRAPLDSDSFARFGQPQKRLADVDRVAATDRNRAVLVDLARTRVPAGRTAAVRMLDRGSGKATYLIQSLAAPPAQLALLLDTHAKRVDGTFDQACPAGSQTYCENGLAADYLASAPSGRLSLNTNSGDRENLWLDVPSLPSRLGFCVATDGDCTGYAKGVPVTGLSARFAASAQVSGVTMVDCVADRVDQNHARCGLDGTGLDDELNLGSRDDLQYLTARHLSARFLELEVNAPPVRGGLVGHAYVNTTGRGRPGDPSGTTRVDGAIRVRASSFDPDCGPDPEVDADGKLKRVRAVLNGVTADQRYATLQIQNSIVGTFPCFVHGVSVPNRGPGNGDDTDFERRGRMDCNVDPPAPVLGRTEFDAAPNFPGGELAGELCRLD